MYFWCASHSIATVQHERTTFVRSFLHRSPQWSTFVARFSIQFLHETKAITSFAYLRLSKIHFTRSNKIALDDEWIFGIHDWIFSNAVQVVYHARLSRLFLRFYAFSTSYWLNHGQWILDCSFFFNGTNVLFQRRTARWTSNYTDIGINNLNRLINKITLAARLP